MRRHAKHVQVTIAEFEYEQDGRSCAVPPHAVAGSGSSSQSNWVSSPGRARSPGPDRATLGRTAGLRRRRSLRARTASGTSATSGRSPRSRISSNNVIALNADPRPGAHASIRRTPDAYARFANDAGDARNVGRPGESSHFRNEPVELIVQFGVEDGRPKQQTAVPPPINVNPVSGVRPRGVN